MFSQIALDLTTEKAVVIYLLTETTTIMAYFKNIYYGNVANSETPQRYAIDNLYRTVRDGLFHNIIHTSRGVEMIPKYDGVCIRTDKRSEVEVHAAIFLISTSKNLKTIQSNSNCESELTLTLDYYQDEKDPTTVVSFLLCNFMSQKVLFKVQNREEDYINIAIDANTIYKMTGTNQNKQIIVSDSNINTTGREKRSKLPRGINTFTTSMRLEKIERSHMNQYILQAGENFVVKMKPFEEQTRPSLFHRKMNMDCGFKRDRKINYESDLIQKDDNHSFECEEIQIDGGPKPQCEKCVYDSSDEDVVDGGSNLGVVATGKEIKGGSYNLSNMYFAGPVFKFTLVYKIKNNDSLSPFTVINRKNVACRHRTYYSNKFNICEILGVCKECRDEIIRQCPLLLDLKNQLQKKN